MIEGEFQFVRDWVYAPFIAAIGGLASFFYGILKKQRIDINDLKEKQGRLDERVKNVEKND